MGCAPHRRPAHEAGGRTPSRAERPNIVFVLTDDLSTDLLSYMPNVRRLQQEGRSFTNYFVTDSFCCPSRSSIFTGQFPHDTGIYTNSGPNGGFAKFTRTGKDRQTFAVALRANGYRTAMMGKYLNGYDRTPYVPPGWSQWDGVGTGGYGGYHYVLNENGGLSTGGTSPADYLTDVLSAKGTAFIDRSAAARTPFLLEIASFAPHLPATPAPRDAHRFLDARAPRGPAFNESDIADKPQWLRSYRRLGHARLAEIDRQYVRRVQSVQAVDRMVGRLRSTLQARGLAKNTYFVFSSDNGYHMGEHRLMPGKTTAFDTDIRVPLIVVGPSVRGGADATLAENTDLAPTFEELTGTRVPASVDGRSLVPLLRGERDAGAPDAILVEHHGPSLAKDDPDRPGPAGGNPPSYTAIRTLDALYVEYKDGDREYYDLRTDPYELDNTVAALPPARLAQLQRTLHNLRTCHGSRCSAAARLN
ncbi:sulfatase [Actinoallomurus sp. NBC_01490]|uniref:sulfatase family protein n=1 Tax=Actinoallomurus sp. NBC_01490 TaxID=2903557 RepID=UPI002E3705E7|nr:sulfatase [Actinoallomurus sp. NBC_01490]